MKKSTKIVIIVIICLVIVELILLKYVFKEEDNSSNINFFESSSEEEEEIVPIEESKTVSVEFSDEEEAGIYKDYTDEIDLNTMESSQGNVKISNTTIKITSGGIYYFSGTSEDANIVVEADKNSDVILVFDNANITSTKTAVINGIKAKSIVVNVVKDSVNTFTDVSTYTEFTDDEEPNATIFSKTDLVINGTGKLIINSNYEDAIASKDTLKIINTNIEITANDDGIRGKDWVAIKNSNIVINSKGDGIKSTNTDEDLGYILIDGGEIIILTEADGIQAETEITINSGNVTINSKEDSIHSNGYIIINDGNLELTSEDDGIHADNNILINDGTINITKSYEGIESSYIKINGGEVSVIASDDGINIAGGNDLSSMGRPGENTFSSASNGRELVINGGTIYVNSDGDGLDSNGSISITGGNITVAGAKNGGNGALDYDNKCTVTGGNLIIYGADGMWQNPTTDSTQYSIAFKVTGNQNDTVELKDSNENVLVSLVTEKAYGMVCISNSDLKQGETYTLYVNRENKGNQELTSIVTSNGTSNDGMMNGNGGNRKEQRY